MSLEAALAELTAEVKTNNELLRQAADGRKEVLAAAERATAPKASARAKKDEAPAPAEAAKDESPAAPAQPDPNDPLNAAILGWVGGTTRQEERAARTAKIKELFGKVGATNAATVPADKRQAFINTIDKLSADGDLVPVEEPAAAKTDGADDLL